MREMEFRGKDVDKAAVHPLLEDVICNKLADEILPRASPPMEREDQRLLRVVIVHEPSHSFQNDARSYMLTEQLAVQVCLQT